MKKILAFFKKNNFFIVLVFLILVYLGLAFKNPFGDSSLISNLEPYPDTLLYSFPAWNWVKGNGWKMAVAEKEIVTSVPHTYGYFLVPFFKIFNDIRAFYVANIVLGLGTIIFFGLALNNILKKNKFFIIGFFGFLLVTNFYFFNQPQLVMAEMVNYFFVSVFLYLLSLKFKWIQLIPMIVLVGITLWLKNTNLVLAGSFGFSFFVKIFWEKLRFLNKKLLVIIGIIFVSMMLIFYLPKISSLSKNAFNLKYFSTNFDFYFSCLTGGECRNLWYWQKMVSWDVVVLFLLGVVLLMFGKDKKILLLELLLPIILLVIAMSLFIDTEGRHVEILVPIILMIGAVGMDKLMVKIKKPIILVTILLGVNLLATSYLANGWEMKIISLKKQVGLNFRHREDPWNYLCLRMVENFMVDKKEAYFGSFLPMYFFDAYKVKLNYLPISAYQDFMLAGRGLQKYFPLPLKNIYLDKLNQGKEIYLSDYYASNGRDAWRAEWNEIVSVGKLEKVFQSPMDNCNIYKLVESRNKKAIK